MAFLEVPSVSAAPATRVFLNAGDDTFIVSNEDTVEIYANTSQGPIGNQEVLADGTLQPIAGGTLTPGATRVALVIQAPSPTTPEHQTVIVYDVGPSFNTENFNIFVGDYTASGQAVPDRYLTLEALSTTARFVRNGNNLVIHNLPITTTSPSDTTAPSLSGAVVTNSAPDKILLTFNEALNAANPPTPANFSASGKTVAAAAFVGNNQVELTVNTPYTNGDTITLDYTPGVLQDADGNLVAAIAAQAVTNQIIGPITLATAPNNAYITYIEAGQSISDGTSALGATPNPGVFAKTQTYFKADQTSTADDGAFALYEFGTNINNPEFNTGQNVGNPTLYLAQRFETDFPDKQLALIEHARGGTGFVSGTGRWAANGDLRRQLIHHYLKPGLSKLVATGQSVYLMPFTWIQGHFDAREQVRADAYQAQLQSLLAEIRSETTLDLKVAIVKLDGNLSTAPGDFPARDTVIAAHQAVAALPGNQLIDIDSIPTGSDNVHYDTAGNIALGNLIYDALAPIELVEYTDTTVEVTSGPTVDSMDLAVTMSLTAGEYGTIYAGAWPVGANPTEAQIIAGTGANAVVTDNFIYDTALTLPINGLTAGTYDFHWVLRDLANNTLVGSDLGRTIAPSGIIHQSEFNGTAGQSLVGYTPEQGTLAVTSGTFVFAASETGIEPSGTASGSGHVAIAGPATTKRKYKSELRANHLSADPNLPIGIVVRYVDDDNYWLVQVRRATVRRMQIFQRQGGSFTEIVREDYAFGPEIAQGGYFRLDVCETNGRIEAQMFTSTNTEYSSLNSVDTTLFNTSRATGFRAGNNNLVEILSFEVTESD